MISSKLGRHRSKKYEKLQDMNIVARIGPAADG
jgi:hypothetical protein